MPDGMNMRVSDPRPLLERLRKLDQRVRQRHILTSMRAGAREASRTFAAAAPVRRFGGLLERAGGRVRAPGFLSRSVSIKKRRGAPAYQVGPNRGGFYGRFQEEGTADRGRGGVLPARPWMRPAWNGSVRRVFRVIADKLEQLLDREERRRARGPR